MNAASNNNGNASATRSPAAPNSYGNLSEAEFLAHEAQLAKTAIGNALADMKSELAKAVDIKLWTHHYPWLAVGAAAATGFTMAAVVTKGTASTGTPDLDGEAERQQLLHETAKAPYNTHSALGGTSRPRLGESLLGSLFSLARTALEASLVSAIRAEGIERGHAEAAAKAASCGIAGAQPGQTTTPTASPEPLSSAAL
jgi:hypothetical protein